MTPAKAHCPLYNTHNLLTNVYIFADCACVLINAALFRTTRVLFRYFCTQSISFLASSPYVLQFFIGLQNQKIGISKCFVKYSIPQIIRAQLMSDNGSFTKNVLFVQFLKHGFFRYLYRTKNVINVFA